MEDNATIITLAPADLGTEIATFEEAFGEYSDEEYSEARGKGKARRAARKAERTQKRSAKKTARQQKKTTRKASRVAERDKRKRTRTSTRQNRKKDKREARISNRMERRKQRKTGRMSARQEKRDMRMKSRMDRRRQKAEERQYRKSLRGGDEEEYEEDYYPDEVGYDDEPYEQDGYGEDGFEDDYGDDYDDYGDDDYGDDDYGDDYDDYGDDDYGDDYDDYGDDDYGDDYDDYEDQSGGNFGDDDYDYENDYSDDEWADEPYDDYEDDDWGYFDATESGADGVVTAPNSRIQKITDKIQWNKEVIARLRTRLAEINGKKPNANRQEKVRKIQQKINERIDRVSWLETKLKRFMGNAKSEAHASNRNQNVGLAMRNSMMARKAAKEGVTPVEKDLDPQISRDKIVVPSSDRKSSLTGTGLNAFDLQDDYDSPNARFVELSSNADGEKSKKKIPWTPIIIGVGIGAVVIVGLTMMQRRKGKK